MNDDKGRLKAFLEEFDRISAQRPPLGAQPSPAMKGPDQEVARAHTYGELVAEITRLRHGNAVLWKRLNQVQNRKDSEIARLRAIIDDAVDIALTLELALARGDAEILPGPSGKDWGYVAWWQRFAKWLDVQWKQKQEVESHD